MESLKSENMSVNSWASFAGATRRSLRATARWNTWVRVPILTVWLTVVYTLILAWYIFLVVTLFWPIVVIWRGFRRQSRMRKVTAARHRELLEHMKEH